VLLRDERRSIEQSLPLRVIRLRELGRVCVRPKDLSHQDHLPSSGSSKHDAELTGTDSGQLKIKLGGLDVSSVPQP
jgi:hypothetical protein